MSRFVVVEQALASRTWPPALHPPRTAGTWATNCARLRETCTGLTGTALAVRLGWDPSKVSTIEHGKFRASEIDLVQYLTMCGKDIDFFEDFKRSWRNAFEEYIVQVPDNLRTLAMAESTAKTITRYDTQSVPGLLQTPEYADGVYRMPGSWPRSESPRSSSSGSTARRFCGTRSAGLLVLRP